MATQTPWTYEEMLLAVEIADRREWRNGNATTPEFIELSEILRTANFPGRSHIDDRFRSPNSVSMKTSNLIAAHPDTNGGLRFTAREQRIVEQFLAGPEVMRALAQSIRAHAGIASIPNATSIQQLDEEEITVATEGGPAYVLTLRRERSRVLRRAKIQQVHLAGGDLSCEVCTFNFQRTYGDLGSEYVEVHHRTPLHVSGEVQSTLADLALLCANCHRMAHRKGWLAIEALADIVAQQR